MLGDATSRVHACAVGFVHCDHVGPRHARAAVSRGPCLRGGLRTLRPGPSAYPGQSRSMPARWASYTATAAVGNPESRGPCLRGGLRTLRPRTWANGPGSWVVHACAVGFVHCDPPRYRPGGGASSLAAGLVRCDSTHGDAGWRAAPAPTRPAPCEGGRCRGEARVRAARGLGQLACCSRRSWPETAHAWRQAEDWQRMQRKKR